MTDQKPCNCTNCNRSCYRYRRDAGVRLKVTPRKVAKQRLAELKAFVNGGAA